MNGLADPRGRAKAASALAAHLGASELIILIKDRALDIFRPAPGFVQTLPGGPSWRKLLDGCQLVGWHEGEVAFPTRAQMTAAYAWMSHSAIFVLLGNPPRLNKAELESLPFALAASMLCAEGDELASVGLVSAARDATRRATSLAAALDAARAEIQSKASQLRGALEEAARLNNALAMLNDTLEIRIVERTTELAQANESLHNEMDERRRAEAALIQAQRMEAVGRLTGGVAHDFNNLLTVILGSLEILASVVEGNQRASRLVASALQAGERSAQLIAQLLAFSRNQPLSPESVDLNDLLRQFENLLVKAVGETVNVEFSFDPWLCRCRVDPAQFQSAILNLAINARDAMPNGGRLYIATSNAGHVNALLTHPDLPPGEYATVTVQDDGVGIVTEILPRIFEPFFTTKDVGQGTGLGLAQIYGFVRQSGGSISVSSQVGEGSTFEILFPKAEGAEHLSVAGGRPKHCGS